MAATTPAIVIDGPSKYDLMLALFDANVDRPRPVTFTLQKETWEPQMVKMTIVQVTRENETGESWMVQGYMEGSKDLVQMHFNTTSRRGTAQLLYAVMKALQERSRA